MKPTDNPPVVTGGKSTVSIIWCDEIGLDVAGEVHLQHESESIKEKHNMYRMQVLPCERRVPGVWLRSERRRRRKVVSKHSHVYELHMIKDKLHSCAGTDDDER